MTSTTTDRRFGVNSGMAVKVPVRAASTGNLTLSGEQSIDGIACVTDDRVLVKNQTTTANNGVYVVDTGTWTRAVDFDGAFDIVKGTFVHVIEGSTLGGSWWEVSTTSPVIGSSLAFTQTLLGASSTVSFIQAGTGATSRTAQAKLREFFTPEDFGAAGDGTTDDTTAVQAALDASSHVRLVNSYKVTTTPNASSRVTVTGPGKIVLGAAAIAGLKLSSDGSMVQGITITNPADLGSSAADLIGIDINASNCIVSNNRLDGMILGVRSFTDKVYNTIIGNVITNVKGVASENRGDGILVLGAHCTVTGNTVTCKATTDGRIGIVADEIGTPVGYNTISGNTISGAFRRSIHVELSPYATVQGNTCFTPTNWGIIIATGSDGASVIGNQVDTPATATSTLGDCIGIYFNTVSFCKAEGNIVIAKGARYGMQQTVNAKFGNQFIGNQIVGTAGSITLNGIAVLNCDEALVAHNYIQSGVCTSQGINVNGSVRSKVIGNSVQGCGSHGIIVQASSDQCVITENLCRNNTGIGITVENSINSIVSDNRCYDDSTSTQTHGVRCANSANTLVEGNNLRGNATAPFVTSGARDGLLLRNNMGLEDATQVLEVVDHFLGDVLADQWGSHVGTDPQVVAPAILAGQRGGVFRMVTGDDAAADMATNGVQLESALNWRTNEGGLVFEGRFALSAITNVVVYLGFTSQLAALQMPFTISGTTLTSNTVDGCGVLFDTDATTDNWKLVGVANNVDATVQDAGVAPTAATFETWRIEITTGNVATFYRNGTLIGTAMTGAVTGTVLLTPVVAAFARAAASRNIDGDYILTRAVL